MSTHTFAWSHGRAEVVTTAGMLSRCEFLLGDDLFSPFAQASWAPDDHPQLPGHLRVLGAEFVCLPFGEGGAVSRPAEGWKTIGELAPNAPGHGRSADAEWDVVEEHSGGITLRLEYPEPHDIASIERRIDGIPGVAGLSLSLTITARRPIRTSLGLHPILRLPPDPRSLQIDAGFGFGMTYPADIVAGSTRAERGAVFAELSAVPLERTEGEATDDFSSLPFDAPTEEVVQLCGVTRPIVVHYLNEGASLTIEWDRDLLPSAQLWISDRALEGSPWNRTYRGLGVEPIASAFDLAEGASVRPNPINARGVATAVDLMPGLPLRTEYRMVASASIK